MLTPGRYFLEPINTLTHLAGTAASIFGLITLLRSTYDDPPKMISMFIYGSSLIFLYAVSSSLHGVKTSEENRMRLNRLDHMAIFLLIAGTYTPITYNVFGNPWRWANLGFVWAMVSLGAAFKLYSEKIHGFLNTFIYILLGWGGAIPLLFASNFSLIPLPGLAWILAGGLFYSIGFIIYYYQRPDPYPGVFGHHEIWHLFVMGGSLSHYLFILRYVVPFERTAVG